MEQQFVTNSPNHLMELFDSKRKEIVSHCKEVAEKIAENEFDLFEFNLFISSIGKKKLNDSTKKVRKLRAKVDKGEVDLSEYEDLLNKY